MMLRNRSRSLIGKQSLIADPHRPPQPHNHRLTKLRFFSDPTNPTMTPALMLQPFFGLGGRFPDRFPGAKKRSWEDIESRGIGLAIVDKLFDKIPDRSHTNGNLVLFGSATRVQIPPVDQCPESPTDFGIKTKNSNPLSPDHMASDSNSPRVFTECLSMSEMELSEDYTCVTYHGPNARTTHIFDNCIVENYYSSSVSPGNPKSVPLTPETMLIPNPKAGRPPQSPSFLSFCYTCKKSLEETIDIYIYRGEKSFCSQECRHREIMLDGVDDIEAIK